MDLVSCRLPSVCRPLNLLFTNLYMMYTVHVIITIHQHVVKMSESRGNTRTSILPGPQIVCLPYKLGLYERACTTSFCFNWREKCLGQLIRTDTRKQLMEHTTEFYFVTWYLVQIGNAMATTFCIPRQVVNKMDTVWNVIDSMDMCVYIAQYGYCSLQAAKSIGTHSKQRF